MKILILTITAGQGHNQTAKAIANYAVSHGHNALILDALEYISPIIKDSVNHALLLATSISPKAYGKLLRGRRYSSPVVQGRHGGGSSGSYRHQPAEIQVHSARWKQG